MQNLNCSFINSPFNLSISIDEGHQAFTTTIELSSVALLSQISLDQETFFSLIGRISTTAGKVLEKSKTFFTQAIDQHEISMRQKSWFIFSFGESAKTSESNSIKLIGNPFTPEDSSSLVQCSEPDLEISSDKHLGNSMMVWSESDEKGGVYGSYVTISSGRSHSIRKFNVENAVIAKSPKIVKFPDGGFVVVWNKISSDQISSSIVGRIISSDGFPTSRQFRINQEIGFWHNSPSVTSLNNDRFIVAWECGLKGVVISYICARILDRGGRPIGDEKIVNKVSSALQFIPKVIRVAEDLLVFAWYSRYKSSDNYSPIIKFFNSRLIPQSQEIFMNEEEKGPFNLKLLERENSISIIPFMDRLLVAWASYKNRIEAQFVNFSGSFIHSRFFLDQEEGINSNPNGIILETCLAVVVWNSYYNANISILKGRLINIFGQTVGEQFNATKPFQSDSQRAPAIARIDSNRFAVAWQSYDSNENSKVYAQELSYNP